MVFLWGMLLTLCDSNYRAKFLSVDGSRLLGESKKS